MANSFTSTPGLYILAYALFISNLIPFCEQHHNSYHGKCTVYTLCHVNAKVIISLQIKVLPQKKVVRPVFNGNPAVRWDECCNSSTKKCFCSLQQLTKRCWCCSTDIVGALPWTEHELQ